MITSGLTQQSQTPRPLHALNPKAPNLYRLYSEVRGLLSSPITTHEPPRTGGLGGYDSNPVRNVEERISAHDKGYNYPKALRTHILRLLGPKTILYMVRRLAFPAPPPPQWYGLVRGGGGGGLACAERGGGRWSCSWRNGQASQTRPA